MKKTRTGSKVRRIYDDPQTPYHRVLASESVSDEVKARLKQQYTTLNPVALKRELTRLSEDLLRLNEGGARGGRLMNRHRQRQRVHQSSSGALVVARIARTTPATSSPQGRRRMPGQGVKGYSPGLIIFSTPSTLRRRSNSSTTWLPTRAPS